MCQPSLTFANCFANSSKRFAEKFFPSQLARVVGSGIILPDTNAPRWVRRAGFGQTSVVSAQKVMFHGRILPEFGVVARYTAFCFSQSLTAESKLCTPQPMRLCVLGSDDDMMSSTARWSLKLLAFLTIMNCSAQEYDTPSPTNGEGDHCKKQDGGCQNNTTLYVEYSREGLKADGTNPSEAVLGIWTCNVPVREHQVSAVRACDVLVREHKASGSRCESGPMVCRVVFPSLFVEKSQEAVRTALEDAGSSTLRLLDERCDSLLD